MSNAYQVEVLLRPAVELHASFVAGTFALIAYLAPWALMMPQNVAQVSALLFLAIAVHRAKQGLHVLRYQRNLKKQPDYVVKAKNIPVSPHRLFVGKGFDWQPIHTQRLRDTRLPENTHYTLPSRLNRWARKKEVEWENIPVLSVLSFWWRSPRWWNPFPPPSPAGGNPFLHGVELNEQIISIPMVERGGHTLVLGTTGVGKTRFASYAIRQDIKRGDTVIVVDPKGDSELLRSVYAEAMASGRLDDMHLFHLGFPDESDFYNPIGRFFNISQVATRLANQLPSEGNAASFKEFAWRFINTIASALFASGARPDYRLIRRYITDIEPLFIKYAEHHLTTFGDKEWRHAVTQMELNIDDKKLSFAEKGRSHKGLALKNYILKNEIYESVLDGLLTAYKFDKTFYDKIIASAGPLLEKLTSGKIAHLLSPNYGDTDTKKKTIDWHNIIRSGGIVYIGLDAMADVTLSSAIGSSIFSDCVATMAEIYKHGIDQGIDPAGNAARRDVNICIHADEFNELIGDEFLPLINKARGAGAKVTAYTQTISDIEARVGKASKAGQITGNFNNVIVMRVKEEKTAEILTRELPAVEVKAKTNVSGYTDSSDPESNSDFVSRSEDRVTTSETKMLDTSDLFALPRGHAFLIKQGGKLSKVRLPMEHPLDNQHVPEHINQMAAEIQKNQGLNDNWYQEEPWWQQVTEDTIQKPWQFSEIV